MGLKLKSKRINNGGSYFLAQTETEFIHSGCAVLNCVLGGGWALGRIVNVVGDKAVGKTLVAIEVCCNFVAKFPTSGKIRYLEPEAAFDKSYAAALGLPVDRVSFAPEGIDTVEGFHDDLASFINSLKGSEPGLYIVDSLDALSSKAELDRDIQDASYGDGKAKKMSELFRRLNKDVKEKRVLVFIISQVRDNIGISFGEKHTRSGGKALDFYASQILWLAQTTTIKRVINRQERVIGVSVRAKCKKNKVGMPFRECGFDIRFGYGIDDFAANVKYLRDVGRLSLIQTGLGPEGVTRFLSTLEAHGHDSRSIWRSKIEEAVQQTWLEIERSFLPTQRKYE